MDLSRFKKSDWMMVGGGLGFLVFGTFFDWWTWDAVLFEVSEGNAFDFFFRGIVPWILIVGTGVMAFLLASGIVKRTTAPWGLIFLAATALGTFLNFFILLASPGEGGSRTVWLYLSFISAVVAFAGAAISFKESGGTMTDLRDVNKLKGAFGQGQADNPPPPPSA